jgi:nucleoside-diphosphate-sugar epimerase
MSHRIGKGVQKVVMRILVTGGAGYIGSHATRLFLSRGHEVWIYDNMSQGHRQAVPAERLVIGDLNDRNTLGATFRRQKIEAVVHFAGLTDVRESVSNPDRYYQNNVVGALNLLEAARKCDVTRFVLSSTAAVYGIPKRVPIVESDPCRPINPYGRTKLIVEQMLADYASGYGLGYASLRYFNAAGVIPPRHTSFHLFFKSHSGKGVRSRYLEQTIQRPTAHAFATMFMSAISRTHIYWLWSKSSQVSAVRLTLGRAAAIAFMK